VNDTQPTLKDGSRTSVFLGQKILAVLRVKSAQRNISVSNLIRRAVCEHLGVKDGDNVAYRPHRMNRRGRR
jgi:Ribbon-helix-helix protein, copG family